MVQHGAATSLAAHWLLIPLTKHRTGRPVRPQLSSCKSPTETQNVKVVLLQLLEKNGFAIDSTASAIMPQPICTPKTCSLKRCALESSSTPTWSVPDPTCTQHQKQTTSLMLHKVSRKEEMFGSRNLWHKYRSYYFTLFINIDQYLIYIYIHTYHYYIILY
jgi:hypothetical protein